MAEGRATAVTLQVLYRIDNTSGSEFALSQIRRKYFVTKVLNRSMPEIPNSTFLCNNRKYLE